MKWNATDPVEDEQYLCAIKNSSRPIILYWRNDIKEWGIWANNEYWQSFGNNIVLYYMDLNDIPMPEGW